MGPRFEDNVLNLVAPRRGHFLLESGHHGELWLDLELLCLRPDLLQSLSAELAKRLTQFDIEVVCGPLVEGAFVGLLVAAELGRSFSYSQRFARPSEEGLFPAGYRLPDSLRRTIQGKRVCIVNDVINAGSAVRSTFEDLERCGANIVAIGALLTLGTPAQEFATGKNVPLESLANLPNTLWSPGACPLCASGIPLQDEAGFGSEASKNRLR